MKIFLKHFFKRLFKVLHCIAYTLFCFRLIWWLLDKKFPAQVDTNKLFHCIRNSMMGINIVCLLFKSWHFNHGEVSVRESYDKLPHLFFRLSPQRCLLP